MLSNHAVAMQPSVRALDTTERVAFRNILVATDLSLAAAKGVRYACEIARRYNAMLHVAHIYNPAVYPYAPGSAWPELAEADRDFRERGKEKLQEELRPFPHELLFEEGEVCAKLADLVREKQADLLVLGTHGRSGFEKMLMGSVAEKLFHEARCPVLTIGPKVAQQVRGTAELNRILYATDFTTESLAAAPYAISLAREHRAHLILLNCFEGEHDSVQAMQQTLRQLVPFGADLRCEPICIVERGHHGDKILSVAEGHDADLLVLGVDGAPALAQKPHFRGSALYKIVTHATCPVLTVRA